MSLFPSFLFFLSGSLFGGLRWRQAGKHSHCFSWGWVINQRSSFTGRLLLQTSLDRLEIWYFAGKVICLSVYNRNGIFHGWLGNYINSCLCLPGMSIRTCYSNWLDVHLPLSWDKSKIHSVTKEDCPKWSCFPYIWKQIMCNARQVTLNDKVKIGVSLLILWPLYSKTRVGRNLGSQLTSHPLSMTIIWLSLTGICEVLFRN